MDWDGLILSDTADSALFLLVLSTPLIADDPRVVVAPARRYAGDPDDSSDEEIILSSNDWPGPGPGFDLRIQQPRIGLGYTEKILDRIRFHRQLSIVGNLDLYVLRKLRDRLSRSRHVIGAVKEHLKAWSP